MPWCPSSGAVEGLTRSGHWYETEAVPLRFLDTEPVWSAGSPGHPPVRRRGRRAVPPGGRAMGCEWPARLRPRSLPCGSGGCGPVDQGDAASVVGHVDRVDGLTLGVSSGTRGDEGDVRGAGGVYSSGAVLGFGCRHRDRCLVCGVQGVCRGDEWHRHRAVADGDGRWRRQWVECRSGGAGRGDDGSTEAGEAGQSQHTPASEADR